MDAPIAVLSTANRFGVVAASMVQTSYGERDGQAPRALDIQAPVGAQVTAGGKHAVVGAWMVQHNLGLVGHAADAPLSTLTTAGTQQQVAGAYLTKLRGTSTAQDGGEPVPTLSAGGNHVGPTAAYLAIARGQSTAQDAESRCRP